MPRAISLIGVLRSDEEFHRDYDSRVDDLFAENRIWIRHKDGSLTAPPDQLSSPEWMPAYIAMQKKLAQGGFTDRAVSVLKRAGYDAWINPVRHVAVDPTRIYGM
jgi:hypothetical protein